MQPAKQTRQQAVSHDQVVEALDELQSDKVRTDQLPLPLNKQVKNKTSVGAAL